MNGTLQAMFECLDQGDRVYLPSRYWEMLNDRNLQQLESVGYENFKQTVAQNYFTWLVGPRSNQFRYLLRQTSPAVWPSLLRGFLTQDRQEQVSRRQQFLLYVFTTMLWTYTANHDCVRLTSTLEEPREGNPFDIRLDGKLISQDLANSILEYCSISEHFSPSPEARVTICELGAGYGRNAFVFAHALPRCRYIIVDIPPALYIAQRYLTSVLTGRTVFPFRCFGNVAEVAPELEQADLVFLLPHQAAMLPDKSVDLFINISSLHEMNDAQIDIYLKLIDRLTRGVFYSKQWLVSRNPYDDTVIRQSDYPIPRHWRELYSRRAQVQRSFFEAMYATH